MKPFAVAASVPIQPSGGGFHAISRAQEIRESRYFLLGWRNSVQVNAPARCAEIIGATGQQAGDNTSQDVPDPEVARPTLPSRHTQALPAGLATNVCAP